MARAIEKSRIQRETFSRIPEIMELPNLMELQRKSYEEFLAEYTLRKS